MENLTSNSFLVTGHGRSGTKFLAVMMNKSKIWTVKHEPFPRSLDCDLASIQKRFDNKFYGEVNSYRRLIFYDLKVHKRGILIRDPFEIATSAINRKGWSDSIGEGLIEAIDIIEKAIEDVNCLNISFKKMTTNLGYLAKTIKYFGISDVSLKKKDLLPINANLNKAYSQFKELPTEIKSILSPACSEFYEKHKELL